MGVTEANHLNTLKVFFKNLANHTYTRLRRFPTQLSSNHKFNLQKIRHFSILIGSKVTEFLRLRFKIYMYEDLKSLLFKLNYSVIEKMTGYNKC